MTGNVGLGGSRLVPPFDGLRIVMKARYAALTFVASLVAGVALIGEDVPGMIEHDIEDDVKALCMGGVDQGAKLVVGRGGHIGKPGLGTQEVMNTITVVGRVELQVLEHRAQPDRACTSCLM